MGYELTWRGEMDAVEEGSKRVAGGEALGVVMFGKDHVGEEEVDNEVD